MLNLTIISSDISLSFDRRQTIIWTNAGMFLIGQIGTNKTINVHIPLYCFRWNVFIRWWVPEAELLTKVRLCYFALKSVNPSRQMLRVRHSFHFNQMWPLFSMIVYF